MIKWLFYIGLILIVSGIMYEIFAINIPFQDPTAEMTLQRNNQYMIKKILLYSGFGMLILALVKGLIHYKSKL